MATKEKKRITVPRDFEPKFIEQLDNRHAIVKEINRRYETLREDVGKESAQRDMLVRRAVFLSVMLETQEHEALEGGKLDTGGYVQGCNALQGLLKALGLDRQANPATDLKSYIADKKRVAKK